MATKSFFRLENLSVRADGLSSMAHALRDCFVEGPNAPETYNDAIDLLSNLMYDFKNAQNEVIGELYNERKEAKNNMS